MGLILDSSVVIAAERQRESVPQLMRRIVAVAGEQRAQGVTIPYADLLIGVTALENGYNVATANLRHFRMIPGIELVQL